MNMTTAYQKRIMAGFLSALALATTTHAHAASVQINFSGVIVNSGAGDFEDFLGLGADDTLSGYVIFDASVPADLISGSDGFEVTEFYESLATTPAQLHVDGLNLDVNINYANFATLDGVGISLFFESTDTSTGLPPIMFGISNGAGDIPFFNNEPGYFPVDFNQDSVLNHYIYGYIDDSPYDSKATTFEMTDISVQLVNDGPTEVPLPAAAWLMLSGIGGLLGSGRLRKAT
jgi:hypothetical protein